MGELASALEVSGPAACMLADRLVSHGLAERRSDPSDRRVVRVVRTERGKRLVKRYEMAQRHALDALVERLSDDQLADWVEILASLAGDLVPVQVAAGERAGKGVR